MFVSCIDIVVTKHGLVNMDLGLHKIVKQHPFSYPRPTYGFFREILSEDLENVKAMLEAC